MKRFHNISIDKYGTALQAVSDHFTRNGFKPIDFKVKYDDGTTGTICIMSPYIKIIKQNNPYRVSYVGFY